MRRALLTLILLWPLAGGSEDGTRHAGSPPFHMGDSLLEWCRMEESQETLLCIGYLAGVSDALEAIAVSAGFPSPVCRPRGTTLGALRDEVIEWGTAHPRMQERAGSVLVITALQNAFPCTAEQ